MLSQNNVPLLNAIKNYLRKGIVPFHTPGHRGGSALRGLSVRGQEPWALDLTEIPDLDGGSSEARRGEAECLAAEFFGAEETHFLANGATEGVLALLLALGSPGDEIIVVRDCHVSVVHGLILSGLAPVFVAPNWVPGWSLPCLPTPEQFQSVLDAHPRAKAVWITHPSYAGVTGALAPIAQVVHNAGLPLIIDEAHGGYLRWTGSDDLEARDLADAWIHGSHKIMGSLTQTGLLHLQGQRIDRSRIARTLSWVRSTSPSYILLSSIDVVRRFMAVDGKAYFERTASAALFLRNELASQQVRILSDSDEGYYSVDPMKLVVSWRDQGWTGSAARQCLAEKYRIQPEFFDRENVGFFFSPVQNPRDYQKLRQAALEINRVSIAAPLASIGPPPLQEGVLKSPPRAASFEEMEWVPWNHAVGRIAGHCIAPYPPGIPLWCPGERISQNAVEWFGEFKKAGGIVTGIKGEQVPVLKGSSDSY